MRDLEAIFCKLVVFECYNVPTKSDCCEVVRLLVSKVSQFESNAMTFQAFSGTEKSSPGQNNPSTAFLQPLGPVTEKR